MAPCPRKIVEKTYYYATDSESESEENSRVTRFVFPNGEDETWIDELSSDSEQSVYDPERDSESDSEDSDEGTEYDSETEPESDSEELDEPKPYYGKGFRVYFDSTADKKFFMQSFGFLDA